MTVDASLWGYARENYGWQSTTIAVRKSDGWETRTNLFPMESLSRNEILGGVQNSADRLFHDMLGDQ